MPAPKAKCERCLWHWPAINGEEGYRCYQPQSFNYHKECQKWCAFFETRVDVKPIITKAQKGKKD